MLSEYQVNKALKYLKTTLDDQHLRDAINNFIIFYERTEIKVKTACATDLINFIKLFKNFTFEDICWDLMCRQLRYTQNQKVRSLVYNFYDFLVANNYYIGRYTNFLKNNRWIFNVEPGFHYMAYFYVGSNPCNIYDIIIPEVRKNRKSNRMMRFDFNTDSEIIRNILKEFINYTSKNKFSFNNFQKFVYYFHNSLAAMEKLPKSIQNFTFNTFKLQYRFYRKIICPVGQKKLSTVLNDFYVFLIDYVKDYKIKHEVFSIDSGINKAYLLNMHFHSLYSSNYRVVYFNRNDSIPKINRWILIPNGEEKRTISMNNTSYIKIDFLTINDEEMREYVKRWMWESPVNLKTKRYSIYNIILFLNVINNKKYFRYLDSNVIYPSTSLDQESALPNESNLWKNNKINTKRVSLFRTYLINEYSEPKTRNIILYSVRSFLYYLFDNLICCFDKHVFDFLIEFYDNSSPNPIDKDELKQITNVFKERRESEGTLGQLDWIIYNICVTTNLRIGEIVNLQRDCLFETMKKGQYALKYICTDESDANEGEKSILNLIRKGSNGVLKEYNLNEYTLRYIRDAKRLTEEFANNSDSDTKSYLFLRKSLRGRVIPYDERYFAWVFKKAIKDLNFRDKSYSVYNLRHTYMSIIYEQGKKDGVDLLDIHAATGHADLATTIKNYRISNIREYLEAFHHVRIGNVAVSGEIVEDVKDVMGNLPEDISSITVKNGCGYCKNRFCDENSVFVDCLLCKNFITTLNKIPVFEDCIRNLDMIIANEDIEHEKEHKVAIKKLYVAYLECLYILKASKEEYYEKSNS